MPSVVERASAVLEQLVSRRNFMTRSAMVGSAFAVGAGLDLVLRPGSAYGAICSCGNQGCSCGSTCCAGFSEFCCSVNNGQNACPSGTVIAGWWKADNSTYCSGPRYYMDCNALCGCENGCGGGWQFCDPGCDGLRCGCGSGSCDHWLTGCLQFRYGQCNQDVSCLGRIVCRVVSCIPPWEIDSTCTTAVAVDNGTAQHNAPCWTASPPELAGEMMPVSQAVRYRPGQIDIFQVWQGTLLHKWTTDGLNWGNENVGQVAGAPPGIVFVGPPMVVASPGSICQVTVESDTGRVWYFVQGQTTGWGVGELP
jgi:hypothetical protein